MRNNWNWLRTMSDQVAEFVLWWSPLHHPCGGVSIHEYQRRMRASWMIATGLHNNASWWLLNEDEDITCPRWSVSDHNLGSQAHSALGHRTVSQIIFEYLTITPCQHKCKIVKNSTSCLRSGLCWPAWVTGAEMMDEKRLLSYNWYHQLLAFLAPASSGGTNYRLSLGMRVAWAGIKWYLESKQQLANNPLSSRYLSKQSHCHHCPLVTRVTCPAMTIWLIVSQPLENIDIYILLQLPNVVKPK